MEHIIFTSVVGLGSLMAVFAPFYYFSHASKRASNHRFNVLKIHAEYIQLNLSEREAWGKYYALGLDRNNEKLIYLKIDPNQPEEVIVINLSDLISCDKVIKYRINDGNKLFERLSLICKLKSDLSADLSLNFFVSSGSIALQGELQALNKWHSIINSFIKK
jgi:hypothetical protein